MGEPTTNGAAILRARSTTLSVIAFISGEYSFNESSSFLSDARIDSAYANIISWVVWGVAEIRTEVVAENLSSRISSWFPILMATVLLYQKLVD